MGAARFLGRVDWIAAALGTGVVILGGTAVASAALAARSTPSARVRGVSPAAQAIAGPAASVLPQAAAGTVTLSAPAAPVRTAGVRSPSAAGAPAVVPSPTPPNPDATVETPYGVLGQWMINKREEVANWIEQPYCGTGSTVGNCKADNPDAKIMQEPINTIFVVQANNE